LKLLWDKIIGGLAAVKDFLIAYGPLGLFGIALLDSALIPLPGGPDVVMILLSKGRPAWMLLYAAAATLGSVVGCVILYYISRRAGRRALERFSEKKQARVKELIDRYDVLSVLVVSVLPPPFPFKLFIITCGVLRLSIMRFAIAIAFGRAFRFLLEGYLAVNYGDQAESLFRQYFPWIGLGLAVLIIFGFIAWMLWRKRASVREQRLDAGG
jgi:membrane protein YqaA with SNARE-associated domain